MTAQDKNEWAEFKEEIQGNIKQILQTTGELHDDVLLLKAKVVPENRVHEIAKSKVSECKKHREEVEEAKKSAESSSGVGFFASMTAGQRSLFISLLLGILFAISGWIKSETSGIKPEPKKEDVSHGTHK